MHKLALLPALVISSSVCFAACKSKTEPKPTAAAASASAPLRSPAPKRKTWPLPSGPVLAVLAGQGVGPIRIGATVPTIQRLMALPCEVKTPEVCRYPNRGVEFLLENGVTKRVHVHRAGRPAGKDASGKEVEYGFFNGAIPPDLQMGMIPRAIQEHLGQPKHVERREVTGEALNVEVHHYDGMRIEYDRLPNGNLVMGGILILKEPPSDAGAGGSSSAAKK